MKTNFNFIFILIFGIMSMQAQNRTTVIANSVDISDNLDLRAIASLFGESATLEDFERRLNDPEIQISNLDLNNDNQVDYLRIIESVENRTHLIIIQSVLGRDLFQDVATIEIERMRNNQLQVQIVGDVFMYGSNYIYEPVYHYNPVIYNTFWVNSYRPYCSPWYWNYYPRFYFAWNPYPYFRYRTHVNYYVNYNNTCNYVNYRRSSHAIVMHNQYRTNSFERQYPNRSFSQRNSGYQNRSELTQIRGDNSTRGQIANSNPRPSRADSYSSSSSSGTRNPTVNSASNSPRPSSPRSSTYSQPANDNMPNPRAQNPRTYSPKTESVVSTPKPRVGSSKNEVLASNYPRSTSSTYSNGSEYSSPRTNPIKSKDYSTNNIPKSTPRATKNQMQSNNSYGSQPRVNTAPRAQRSNSESRNQSNSSSRSSESSMRRG